MNGDTTAVDSCRICGCTDDCACPGGCWWVEDNLCSQCSAALEAFECSEEELKAIYDNATQPRSLPIETAIRYVSGIVNALPFEDLSEFSASVSAMVCIKRVFEVEKRNPRKKVSHKTGPARVDAAGAAGENEIQKEGVSE